MTMTLWLLFISFRMNIPGVKFEEHFFYISRDILYSVFYNFSCTTCDVITFLICIMEKRQYLQNEKRYSKEENVMIILFEKPVKINKLQEVPFILC